MPPARSRPPLGEQGIVLHTQSQRTLPSMTPPLASPASSPFSSPPSPPSPLPPLLLSVSSSTSTSSSAAPSLTLGQTQKQTQTHSQSPFEPQFPRDISETLQQRLVLELNLASLSARTAIPFRARDAPSASSGGAVRYIVHRRAAASGAPPPDLIVRDASPAALEKWAISTGRQWREKYLAKVGRRYAMQIVVQTWLPRLPKRVDAVYHEPGRRSGVRVLSIHGDALSKRFSVCVSLDAGAGQIARAKRVTRVVPAARDGLAIVATEWELRLEPGVDASLIVALACILEGFVEDADAASSAAAAPPPAPTRAPDRRRHLRTQSAEVEGDPSAPAAPPASARATGHGVRGTRRAHHAAVMRGLQPFPRSHSEDSGRGRIHEPGQQR
jgi:hypothetical protein